MCGVKCDSLWEAPAGLFAAISRANVLFPSFFCWLYREIGHRSPAHGAPPFLASSPPHLLHAASILCRKQQLSGGNPPPPTTTTPPAPWSGTPAVFLPGVYGRRLDFGLSSYVTLPDPTGWCNASLPAPALTIAKPWLEILDCGNTAENLPTFYPRLSVKKIGFSGDLGRNVSQWQLHTAWIFTTILARCQTFAGWRVLPWTSSDFPSSRNTDVIHKQLNDPHHQNHDAGWLFLDREFKTFRSDRTSTVNRAGGQSEDATAADNTGLGAELSHV